MNIFALHHDPVICARYHNNKHVVKMVLEYAQILSTVHHLTGSDFDVYKVYKPTHKGHPCVLWAKETDSNYIWLSHLALALAKEYTYRYNGREHASEKVIRYCLHHPPELPDGELTQFATAMPQKYVIPGNPIASYRNYYLNDKAPFNHYKDRSVPPFLQGEFCEDIFTLNAN